MTTILSVSTGKRKRVCNGTCHAAKGQSCKCICGGKYHGKGKKATELLAHDLVRGTGPLVTTALPGFDMETYTVNETVREWIANHNLVAEGVAS